MSVKQQRREGIGKQLRHRIESTLVDARRLVVAEDTPEAERVHGARTRIKRVRALLALLRTDLAHTRLRAEDRALRNVARALGPLRDPVARLEAYDELCAHRALGFPDEWRPVVTRGRDEAPQRRELTARILSHTAAQLANVQARVESWPSSAHATESLAHGFQRNYAAARRAYQTAERNPTPQAMHVLRRRTKRYQYQLQFLQTLRQGQIRARCQHAEALSELLGQHHDLVLLGSALDASCGLEKSALRRLRRALERRERKLRRQALSLARRVYRKRPRQVARLWHGSVA